MLRGRRELLLDEWPEGEFKSTVLAVFDTMISERRLPPRSGPLGEP